MKPVLILQHLHQDGPAYLATWLRRHKRPFEVFNAETGQDFPRGIDGYSALAVLGGEMSANDPLPSLRATERLVLQAMDAGRPVLGHCLGAQLMARALGARVVDSPAPEIGWHRITLQQDDEARVWFGEEPQPVVFQWHYDAFELPPQASLLARSDACPHQAFAVGPHLAMQFHVELDEDKLRAWVHAHDERFFAASDMPTVQQGRGMLNAAHSCMAEQQAMADRIYARWSLLADGT